ncbi:Thioredoxin-like 2 [Seminavis robusta]|uniref:Thioredoxin-like 2 n=1 Tax=Seminavis robusta TaxID=568900 RepID=A0A9N8H345_9STRA|nr:Thioredoxin-like 2 [Seminavis robusta]|eukprot:Sro80_g043020.1 Thioredoxin-like 2 (266) ;mRNA; r:46095-46990
MTRSSLALVFFGLGTAALTGSAFAPSPSTNSRPTKSLGPLHVSSALPTNPMESSNQHQQHHEETVILPPNVHAPVTVINSPQELAAFLEQDERLCVIKFHAAWCKSCQRFGVKFQGLANQKADWIGNNDDDNTVVQPGPMRFGSIEFGANKDMCRALSIKRLPTVHFYQKGQQLEEFPCGPSKFPRLLATIDYFLNPQSSSSASQLFETTLQEGQQLMSSGEVAGVLQEMMAKQAEGTFEQAPANEKANNKQKKKRNVAWWNPMP